MERQMMPVEDIQAGDYVYSPMDWARVELTERAGDVARLYVPVVPQTRGGPWIERPVGYKLAVMRPTGENPWDPSKAAVPFGH